MKWSGLAPAVDAHLQRWSIMKRVAELADVKVEGVTDGQLQRDAQRRVGRVAATDAGMRWLAFARSYGLPQEGGGIAVSFDLVESEAWAGGNAVVESEAWGNMNEGPIDGEQWAHGHGALDQTAVREGSTITGKEKFIDTGESLATGMLLIQREYEMLDAAVTHYVSAEVVEEVTWAAEEAFPEPLFPTDLFTPSGFAVFEKPVRVVDLNVDTGLPDPRVHVDVRAIGWHRHGNIRSPKDGTIDEGVTLFMYTTPDDYIEGYVKELAATGSEYKDPATQDDVEGAFLPLEVIPWRFGIEWEPKPDTINYHIPGMVPSPVAFQRRWFFAFMRLCWQEIIVRHADHEPRQAHRRWERFAKRKELLDYTTLRLRRVVDPLYEPSGFGIPLDHRVKVRAHWRRVYVPSIGGPARLPDGTMNPVNHRAVWIEEHWRGPEDGPVGALHSATSVVR